MIIENQKVIVKWNTKIAKYYIKKGYNFSKEMKEIEVKVEDLTNGSKVLVRCICDYCGKEFKLPYRKAINQGKNPCSPKCSSQKVREGCILKHGVENYAQLESSKEKTKKHFIEKFGVDNPLKYDDIKQKVKKTNLGRYGNTCSMNGITKEKIKQNNLKKYGVKHYSQTNEYKEKYKLKSLEKYGTEHPWQAEEIKQKIKDTNLERYGVECILQLEFIKQKIKKICLDKYGVENPAQAIEVKEKIAQSLYQNKTGISSYNQRYLCNLFNGELNYPIGFYKLDIAFINEMLYIEYDGSGHNLRVQKGAVTEKEFKRLEISRKLYLEKKGWKIIRIISKYDKLFDDDTIINLVNKAKDYLLNTNHTWFEIDIDNKLIKCAEYIMEV